MPVLESGSLIVVTGISGYVASHVGLVALQSGYRVRGTLRDFNHTSSLEAAYAKYGIDTAKMLSFVLVDDLTSEAQYVEAFKDADGVAHVALPAPSANWIDEITSAVIAVLTAAEKTPTIKRVVLTSTMISTRSDVFDRPLTAEDWNDDAVRAYQAFTPEQKQDLRNFLVLYSAGKTISEQKAWKWMEETKPPFEFVSVVTSAVFGPVLHDVPRTTAKWISLLLKNETSQLVFVAPFFFVDIRDNARLNLLGLTSAEFANQRILSAAESSGWNELLAILRKQYPDLGLPEKLEGAPEGGGKMRQTADSEVARIALGGKWVSLEESVVDTAESIWY